MVAEFGQEYLRYQRSTPAFIPAFKPKAAGPSLR
jgi:protein-S-isoprenylcysteine O-methyltransferase Ste14